MTALTKVNLYGPEKLVMAILAKVGETEINKNLAKIHEAFFYFKRDKEFSKYMKDFRFNEMGLSPFSDLLDQVLNMIENSHILATSNPSYETYKLNVPYLNKQFEDIAPNDKENIEEMGKMLRDYVVH
ncbi:MAG: hypothetical protein WC147_09745 [Syntrophomonas sp.]